MSKSYSVHIVLRIDGRDSSDFLTLATEDQPDATAMAAELNNLAGLVNTRLVYARDGNGHPYLSGYQMGPDGRQPCFWCRLDMSHPIHGGLPGLEWPPVELGSSPGPFAAPSARPPLNPPVRPPEPFPHAGRVVDPFDLADRLAALERVFAPFHADDAIRRVRLERVEHRLDKLERAFTEAPGSDGTLGGIICATVDRRFDEKLAAGVDALRGLLRAANLG